MHQEISYEEHKDYLLSSASLALCFAWNWLEKHPEEQFDSVIRSRVDIWRKTKFNPDHIDKVSDDSIYPEWMALLSQMKGIYESAMEKNDFKGFEADCMALLTPVMTERIERDLEFLEGRVDLGNYQCGSLRYNLKVDGDAPQRIGFHIANACYPSSIFEDKKYLPACFMVLMTQCEARFGVTEIGTSTWLNSYPKWLKLFPKEWADNMGEPVTDVRGHYGFWGQFLTARRTFNHKLGEEYRKTGVLPFLPRKSWCTIESMRRHIEENFF